MFNKDTVRGHVNYSYTIHLVMNKKGENQSITLPPPKNGQYTYYGKHPSNMNNTEKC